MVRLLILEMLAVVLSLLRGEVKQVEREDRRSRNSRSSCLCAATSVIVTQQIALRKRYKNRPLYYYYMAVLRAQHPINKLVKLYFFPLLHDDFFSKKKN